MRSPTPVVAAVLACAIASTGCATMRPVQISVTPQTRTFGPVDVGDLVQLTLTDGTRHRFAVNAIEGDAIVSDTGRRYARAEIVQLSRESVDARATIGLTAAIAAGSVIVLRILESIRFFGT